MWIGILRLGRCCCDLGRDMGLGRRLVGSEGYKGCYREESVWTYRGVPSLRALLESAMIQEWRWMMQGGLILSELEVPGSVHAAVTMDAE